MKAVELTTKAINHLNVHFIQTEKFKTIYFVMKIKSFLDKDTITKRALLPYLLRQGTKTYPSEIELQNKLDDLYGATLSLDGAKKGDYHIISVRLEIANDKYIKGEESLINDSLNLLHEIIYEPKTVNNGFDPKIFNREKQTLKNSIESVIDDKMRFANMRLIDEMCKDERYSVRVHGYLEQLEKLNEQSMFEYYQKLLQEDEIDLYIVGDFSKEEMEKVVSKHFHLEKKSQLKPYEMEPVKVIKQPREVIERQHINQAKLHLGYRTNCTIEDEEYFSLQVFNGLLGGFPSSKLFLNVREKHSLAYYAASRIESLKGLLLVFSGIDAKDYHKAKDIIHEQLLSIQTGDFTEENLSETKEQLINNILETMDHPDGIIEMFYQQQFTKNNLNQNELINKLKKVTREDVINIAKKIQLDTIYLLTSEEGESSA